MILIIILFPLALVTSSGAFAKCDARSEKAEKRCVRHFRDVFIACKGFIQISLCRKDSFDHSDNAQIRFGEKDLCSEQRRENVKHCPCHEEKRHQFFSRKSTRKSFAKFDFRSNTEISKQYPIGVKMYQRGPKRGR